MQTVRFRDGAPARRRKSSDSDMGDLPGRRRVRIISDLDLGLRVFADNGCKRGSVKFPRKPLRRDAKGGAKLRRV